VGTAVGSKPHVGRSASRVEHVVTALLLFWRAETPHDGQG
jgi:hypothetical protein